MTPKDRPQDPETARRPGDTQTVYPATPRTLPIPDVAPAAFDQDATVPPGSNPTFDQPQSPHDQPTAAVLGRDPSATPAASESTSIRYFGDYEIVREIARGGMGVVFQARQNSLNRPVALKMILAGQLADDTDVRRFYIEAEAAANLDHPGIVPIYEVGQHEGQHYFSMGFVEGQSLSQRLARGLLPAREAAELIRRVSEAIEYAHRRGVIHRDLKPANILLDANGDPRVTDFGLAKKVQGDSGLTGSGQIMGTPSYMPPEQARGKRGDVGPAADVYALGATLYALVTGRPPFQAASVMDTVIQVISEDPVPPRRLNVSVPRDLETICLKCLEKERSRRYGSAAALGEDLRRFLVGEPVLARPVSQVERGWRWCKRNPWLAGAIGSAAALLVAVAVLSLRYAADRNRAATKIAGLAADLKKENQIANDEARRASDEARRANVEAQRAEEREVLAIDAVKKFRDAVHTHPELKNHPELDSLRKALLKEPLAFFQMLRDQLQADRDASSGNLKRLADANFDLARTTEEIGSIPDAIRSYAESIALHDRIGRDRPADIGCQNHLAQSHNSIGLLLRATGRPAEALSSLRRGLEIFERLARENPSVVQFEDDLAGGYLNIGNVLRATGHPADALASYRRGLEIVDRLARGHPADTRVQDDQALSHNNIGNVLADMGRSADALASSQRALAIHKRLAQDNPAVDRFQSGLAADHDNIGVQLNALGRRTDALDSHRRGLEIFERLSRNHPTVTHFQEDLAICHMNVGVLLDGMGQKSEALTSHRQALAIYERLAREHPTVPNYRSNLGGVLNNIAKLEMDHGRFREARAALEQAISHQRAALASLPRHPVYRRFLRNHLSNLVGAHRVLNQPAEAARAAREWATLARGNPNDLYNVACALALCLPLAGVEQKQALAGEAVQLLREAVAAGWKDAAHTSRDPNLAPLHDRADFRRLLSDLFDRSFPTNPFAP